MRYLLGFLGGMQVNAALLLILDGPASAVDSSIGSIEAGDASIEALLRAGRLQLTCSVHDIAGHDLCTHGGGVSEVLLARWDKGEVELSLTTTHLS